MTDNKKDEKKATNKFEEEFAALPLEEKIAALFRMESKTLGETLTYIANSSAKAVEKASEFINEMSSKIEFEVKRATGESASAEGNAEPKASSAKPKSGERKRGAKPKAPAE
ncbi:MAG: hypothetical protein IPO41_02570 [Acidobacteria bacterium]|nr:hypothetical protein [Acidobacteriota bacterium]MBK9527213.1 hypothetical protein [Acidobacteriota bacterium]MBP7475281.1 hypothetical protein [Pyrinomonadaceae bacterium]MBP9108200.1 hypothetical protein [Pyrinomonadaceae bacterium]